MIKFYFFNFIHFVMQDSIPLIPMCWRCHGSWILVIQRKDTKTSRTAKTKRPAIKPCWRSCGRHCDAPTGTASSSRQKEQSEKKTQNTKMKEDTFDASHASFAIKMAGVRKVQWKSLRLVRAAAGGDHFHICPPITVLRVWGNAI